MGVSNIHLNIQGMGQDINHQNNMCLLSNKLVSKLSWVIIVERVFICKDKKLGAVGNPKMY